MRSATHWRKIPVFISSTFRDMHAERDVLAQVVFPELAERLRGRQCFLEPVDLRWGVETADLGDEAAKELQILRVCVDEIERSRPFQIVLLGERYGWVPSAPRLLEAAETAGLKGIPAGSSVTALEVEVGVFGANSANQRYLVYCRDLADPRSDAAGELAALAGRLEGHAPHRFHHYRAGWDSAAHRAVDLDDMGQRVLADLWSELDEYTREFRSPAQATWQQRQRRQLADFFAHRSRDFVGRGQLLADLTRFAMEPGGNSWDGQWGRCLTGPPGCGKSSVLAQLVSTLQQTDVLLLQHGAGAAEDSASVNRLLRRWIEELGAAVDEATPPPEDLASDHLDELFAHLLSRAAQHRRVVVVFDALDQLEPTDRGRFLPWLPRTWPVDARFIATAQPGDATWALETRAGCRVLPLAALSPDETVELARGICRRHHRELNPLVLAALVGSDDAARHPLWLTVAVEQLNTLGYDDFIRSESDFEGTAEARLLALLRDVAQRMPRTVADLFRWILAGITRRLGEAAALYLRLIAASRFGLREVDLHALMAPLTGHPWNDLDSARVRYAVRGQLVERGEGTWDLVHRSLRETLRSDWVDAVLLHSAIADYLEKLPADDPLRTGELMFHYLRAKDDRRAAAHLAADLGEEARYGASLAVADEICAGDRGGPAAWLGELMWADGLDEAARQRMAARLGEDVSGELARAGRTEQQAALLQVVLEFWRTLAERNRRAAEVHLAWGRAALQLGHLYRELGRSAAAKASYQDGIRAARSLIPHDMPYERGSSQCLNPTRSGQTFSSLRVDMAEIVTLCLCGLGDVTADEGDLKGAEWSYSRIGFESDDPLRTAAGAEIEAAEPLLVNANVALLGIRLGYVWLLRGSGHAAFTHFDQARGLFEVLLDLDPSNTALRREAGVLAGRTSQALRREGAAGAACLAGGDGIRYLEESVAQDPANRGLQTDLAYLHLWHGDAYCDWGDPVTASDHYRTAVRLASRVAATDPDNDEWQRALTAATSRKPTSTPSSAAPRRDPVWDYRRPKILSGSTETDRLDTMDADERRRWREMIESGPRFGDWRTKLDKAQFVLSTRMELGAEAVFNPGLTVTQANDQPATPVEQAGFTEVAGRHGTASFIKSLQRQPGLRAPDAFTDQITRLTEAADRGDARAQHRLGSLYFAGETVRPDIAVAQRWLRAAAEQGYGPAEYDLGYLLFHGENDPAANAEAQRWWERAADNGVLRAGYNLALRYAQGAGVPRDPQRAAALMQAAAEAGMPQAQYNMGVFYAEGIGLPQDPVNAAIWMERAAQNGLAQAWFNLGHYYLAGSGVTPDEQKGVALLTRAAEQGLSRAQTDLASYYASIAEPRDYAKSAMWLTSAAQQDMPEAQYGLGLLYLQGRGVEPDFQAAGHLLRKAADGGEQRAQMVLQLISMYAAAGAPPADARQAFAAQLAEFGLPASEIDPFLDAVEAAATHKAPAPEESVRGAAEAGDAAAQYHLGVFLATHTQPPDYVAAAKWYRKSAEQGYRQAQHNLAYLYLNGQGVPMDVEAGLAWLRRAAQQGLINSQYDLAVFLAEGRYAPPDYAAAARWYRRVAEQGDSAAQYNLALLHLNDQGEAPNVETGLSWLRKAADQGLAEAQYNLAVILMAGEHVLRDPVAAANWYRRSAAQGFPPAQHNLAHMYLEGEGVPRDRDLAIELFRAAAEMRFSPSMSMLAHLEKDAPPP